MEYTLIPHFPVKAAIVYQTTQENTQLTWASAFIPKPYQEPQNTLSTSCQSTSPPQLLQKDTTLVATSHPCHQRTASFPDPVQPAHKPNPTNLDSLRLKLSQKRAFPPSSLRVYPSTVTKVVVLFSISTYMVLKLLL
jgi:hypothetical protein